MTNEEIIRYIQEKFVYNPDGTFTRKDRSGGSGSLDKDGYRIIKIKGKQYKAHRLVFAFFNGRFPKDELDHINHVRSDNRIENLREVSRTENILNRVIAPNSKTGYVGVYQDDCTHGLKKKYSFHIKGKTYRFYTAEEADKAKKEMRKLLYGTD